ncbi:hypothetical protein Hypma_006696 [Hypsizygus marmoreus]|uniref:DUF6570 domain-containing protein n=1 Tax=Hypsizygus marmoreus TaxID=39966 RepID=A0A369JVR2_HYPMA|nr:hypothetical protein Hypma_006696 [Hypsizygus marmoreus]
MVRRSRVKDALHWLTRNNSVYRHMKISKHALDALPEGLALSAQTFAPVFSGARQFGSDEKAFFVDMMTRQPATVMAECFPLLFPSGKGSLNVVFDWGSDDVQMDEDPRFLSMILWSKKYAVIMGHFVA